ncbi:hypothetical protein AB0N81_35005 [Streptomyces sp. NPDC093510]|uniref:hypothetical protein n=1 Tax=Streptomyces sp. NPDC093510 TaxID=3155199 RepID=UPI00342FE5EC
MRPTLSRTVALSAGLLLSAAPVTPALAVAGPGHLTPAYAQQTAPKKATLSAKATVRSIRAWEQFRVYGSSTRLRAGTQVTLQQLQKKGWVSLPIKMRTNKAGAYNLRVKLGIRGLNKIRVVGSGAVSNVVQVTIR